MISRIVINKISQQKMEKFSVNNTSFGTSNPVSKAVNGVVKSDSFDSLESLNVEFHNLVLAQFDKIKDPDEKLSAIKYAIISAHSELKKPINEDISKINDYEALEQKLRKLNYEHIDKMITEGYLVEQMKRDFAVLRLMCHLS